MFSADKLGHNRNNREELSLVGSKSCCLLFGGDEDGEISSILSLQVVVEVVLVAIEVVTVVVRLLIELGKYFSNSEINSLHSLKASCADNKLEFFPVVE